jgi:hypothetical protein
MPLYDFFRISLPYGLKKNTEGKWTPFNREYMPLGYNNDDYKGAVATEEFYHDKPLYTTYKGLTDKAILSFIPEMEIERGGDGKITKFWLYRDATNPMLKPECWDEYIVKVKHLSKFKAEENK